MGFNRDRGRHRLVRFDFVRFARVGSRLRKERQGMNALSSLLNFIANRIQLERQTHTLTTSLSIASGTSANSSYTINKPGYYPACISGWRTINGSGSGGSYALPSSIRFSSASEGTATVQAILRAVGGNVDNCTFQIDVLWQKLGGALRKAFRIIKALALADCGRRCYA